MRSPAFHGDVIASIGRRMAFEFSCLRCRRKKLVAPFQLPASIQARAHELRVADLEAKAYCAPCRARGAEDIGVTVDVVPGHS